MPATLQLRSYRNQSPEALISSVQTGRPGSLQEGENLALENQQRCSMQPAPPGAILCKAGTQQAQTLINVFLFAKQRQKAGQNYHTAAK